MAVQRDIVVLGAGHNALVTAFYLAKKGFRPLVLERRSMVGGAAITEEFHPGFRCSTLAHAGGPPLASIVEDMQLAKFGLERLESPVRLFAPSPDGRALTLFTDPAASAKEIDRFSQKDAASYVELHNSLARLGEILNQLLSLTPPVIEDPSNEDLWKLLKLGKKVRGLGKKEMMRLIRWGPMAVADFVAEFFETDLLRAAVAARGIFGAALGPWSAGSTTLLLLRAAADPYPVGNSAMPRGGMGALTAAMAASAKQAGAEIRTNADVQKILVKNGAVIGIALSSGEEIAAKCVVSGADPRRTLLGLLDPIHLPPSFVVKMQHFRAQGTVAKLNLALDGLPTFTALKQSADRSALSRPHPHRPGHRLSRACLRRLQIRRIFARALSRYFDSHASRSRARASRQARHVHLHAIRSVQAESRGLGANTATRSPTPSSKPSPNTPPISSQNSHGKSSLP